MLHPFNPFRVRTLLVTSTLLAAVSCAAGAEDDGNGGSGGGSTTATNASTTSTGEATSASTGFETSSTGTGLPTGPAEVFGHSATVLYKLNPDTKAVGIVGNFTGCTDVLDIALDKDSRLLATTEEGLYLVDKTTVACSLIKTGTYPNSLAFVPKGTVDPNVEALVGYVEDANGKNQFIRIDPANGNVTNIGAPWNDEYVSSGDIVSVIDGPTYLTVKRGNCSTNDCLVEINPSNGQIQKFLGDIGYARVFGMAFWAGKAYGFTRDGKLFEVSVDGAGAITTQLIATPTGLQFWGAGSTTSAPPVPQ